MPAKYIDTRTVDPDDLKPHPGNPNVGDVDIVRGSVRANGQYRSVVARRLPDGTLELLAGHTTTRAARDELGRVRVEVIECDDATARRIVAADNQTARAATMDERALLELLDKAQADGGIDGTGFDVDDVDDLRALLEEADREPGPDRLERRDRVGDADNVVHSKGLADLKDAYFGGTSRLIVLSYEGPRYVWAVESLAALSNRLGTGSNADTVVALLAEATGTVPPAGGEAMTDGVRDATTPTGVDF